MTDRAEIERLLQMTGRTLEELPNSYPKWKCSDIIRKLPFEWPIEMPVVAGSRILHQSDMIEMLVGALRDALIERDAAIKDIPRACGYCKNYNDPAKIEDGEHGIIVTYCEKECFNVSGVNTGWEWRGVVSA